MLHKTAMTGLATLSLGMGAFAPAIVPSESSAQQTTFRVRVESVSTMNALNTSQGNKPVPLSPGAWAVHTGRNPIFTPGQRADEGLENIAEDGFPMKKAMELKGAAGVKSSGTFAAPAGMKKAIEPGETAEFTITAAPGDRLSFATMFVQSNDLFYAPDESGIELFRDGQPISGNVTSTLTLWDAGTEVDQEPGVGPDQKPRQPSPDHGPAEDQAILRAEQAAGPYSYPPNSEVIRVTITPVMKVRKDMR
jgi:hypothetical protein